MTQSIVMVDYGSGNIRSMQNALARVAPAGTNVVVSADPGAIRAAHRLVLPGVGAFAECKRKLDASGALPVLAERVHAGVPFLGVCVGMQVLGDEGREFETTAGLGWIRGSVRLLEFAPTFDGPKKLPHVGWTPVEAKPTALFAGLPPLPHFYFVHSYALDCAEPSTIAATAWYGERFAAAVLKDNVFGTQFHPEKSDKVGLALLENFCRWNP